MESRPWDPARIVADTVMGECGNVSAGAPEARVHIPAREVGSERDKIKPFLASAGSLRAGAIAVFSASHPD
jgi:hypothetical protein